MQFRKWGWLRCTIAGALALGSACGDATSLDRYSFAEVSVRGAIRDAEGMSVAGARVAVVGVEEVSTSAPCEATAPGSGFTSIVQTAIDGSFAARLQTSPSGSMPICLTLHVSPPTGSVLADTVLFGVKAKTGTSGTGFVPDTVRVTVVLRAR